MNKNIDTTLLDKAMKYAIDAHKGVERRGKGFPYVVHPFEAVAIVATMTNDQELLAAAALHDVVEDTDITVEDLKKEFGERVAKLVEDESDKFFPGVSEADSWHERKQIAIDKIKGLSREGKIVALGDKLSNMRAIARDFDEKGGEIWKIFHVTDPKDHRWHYEGLADSLAELSDTFAYKEFKGLVDRVFVQACNVFEYNIENDWVYVYGRVKGDDVRVLEAELSKDKSKDYKIDFSHVGHIDFSGLRAFINMHDHGVTFCILNAINDVAWTFATTEADSKFAVFRKPNPLVMWKWKESGEGYTAISYNKNDNDAMMKLYKDFMPEELAFREKIIANAAFKCGVPTPLAGNFLKDGKKLAVEYERIVTKKSVARAIADDPDNIELYMKRFTKLVKELHKTPCNKEVFPSFSKLHKDVALKSEGLSDEDKKQIVDFLDNIEETGTCLHGDLQIGNVILTEDEALFIDMADFSYGNPLYDIGTFYYMAKGLPEERCMEMFHVGLETMHKAWDIFVREYYETNDPAEIKKIEEKVRPFIGIQELYFSRISGMPPERRKMIMETMGLE
ncbi:MAG: HD domain-containing protein [Parasporobacterium sp.]|nr:HD domain-containing protein [Parasporobacterium sp.]